MINPGEGMPQRSMENYLSLLRGIEDKSFFTILLDQCSVGRYAIIDGDRENGWWISEIYAVNEAERTLVVGASDGSPRFDFVDPARAWDTELASEKIIEIETVNARAALTDFVEAIENPNPN